MNINFFGMLFALSALAIDVHLHHSAMAIGLDIFVATVNCYFWVQHDYPEA